ncbi:hypothetical protein GXW74_14625 [Roseomonas eburnea]|uniref:Uncharacterized protein n=1 Tax=Neoroseomonas eburnea TaxID=1346889 RepID=A0A9X9XDE0_9PROT|nr:hypothetical protein [Neoroseomonas eburnea]MBR0681726.1 hypothetical protein [Neoroseomonas eburnea]
MYIPPYDAVLRSIGTSREELKGEQAVTVPLSLFRFLLQIAVANGDFNEAGYLAANPDVATAVKSGAIENARLHYIGFGYFEGRQGGTPDVDERWYLRSYPDVEAAVKAGKLASGREHFSMIGAAEWRSPSPRYEADTQQWKRALEAA